MGRTVEELQSTLSYAEWIDWLAFYEISPWGCELEDMRWADLISTLINLKVKNRRHMVKISDVIRQPPKRRSAKGFSFRGLFGFGPKKDR